VGTTKRGGENLKKRVDGKGQGMWVFGGKNTGKGRKRKRKECGNKKKWHGSGPDTPVSDLTAGVKDGRGKDIKVDTVPTSMIRGGANPREGKYDDLPLDWIGVKNEYYARVAWGRRREREIER
jgi:hypothetical protein